MPTYRLLTGTHTHKGITYVASDKGRNILTLTEEQAKALEDRLQIVSQTETTTADSQPAPVSALASPVLVTGFFASEWNAERLASASASEIIDGVGQVTDLDMLDEIHTAEQEGKARITILRAITERYREVEEAQKK